MSGLDGLGGVFCSFDLQSPAGGGAFLFSKTQNTSNQWRMK
jgi:hypothetical protein